MKTKTNYQPGTLVSFTCSKTTAFGHSFKKGTAGVIVARFDRYVRFDIIGDYYDIRVARSGRLIEKVCSDWFAPVESPE